MDHSRKTFLKVTMQVQIGRDFFASKDYFYPIKEASLY